MTLQQQPRSLMLILWIISTLRLGSLGIISGVTVKRLAKLQGVHQSAIYRAIKPGIESGLLFLGESNSRWHGATVSITTAGMRMVTDAMKEDNG